MKLSHTGIRVNNLEHIHKFHSGYSGLESDEKYVNPRKEFSSYMLTAPDGCVLNLCIPGELCNKSRNSLDGMMVSGMESMLMSDKRFTPKFLHLDRMFFSYQTGLMKDDPQLYNHIRKLCRFKPEEALIISSDKNTIGTVESLGYKCCNPEETDLTHLYRQLKNKRYAY